MKNFPLQEQEITALLEQIAPLPITGRAWSKLSCWVAIAILALIGFITLRMFQTHGWHGSVAEWTLLVVIAALVIWVQAMYYSHTTITTKGISQTWLRKKQLTWQEMCNAKFIPMIASKRLVVMIARGRPVFFQGSTPELQKAFAQIALFFGRRPRS